MVLLETRLTALRIEVKSLEMGLIEHLAAPAIYRCLYGHLCYFGIQYCKGEIIFLIFHEETTFDCVAAINVGLPCGLPKPTSTLL
jgi:hypothetical protein